MGLNVKVGSFTAPGVTGNQDITGLGFDDTQLVIFWFNLTASDGTSADAVFGVGVGISSSDRRSSGDYSTDNLSSSLHQAWNQNGHCIYSPSGTQRADYVGAITDGFRINWITTSLQSVNYMAIGGSDITNVKSTAFACPTVTGNHTFTGIGFEGTCMIAFAGKFSTDNLDQSTNGAAFFGFATSASDQGCVAWRSKHAANPQVAKHRQSKSKCAISLTDAGVFSEAEFVDFTSDGFTWNFTTAPTSADIFYCIVLRGPQFKVSNFLQPASTGNQTLTGAGFTPKGSLMLSGNDTAANDDATLANAQVSLGGASGSSERGCIWAGEVDAVSPTQADHNLDRTKLIKMISPGSLTVNAAADHSSFNSDGQVINWTSADATAREGLVLWIGEAAVVPPSQGDPSYRQLPMRPAMFAPGLVR